MLSENTYILNSTHYNRTALVDSFIMKLITHDPKCGKTKCLNNEQELKSFIDGRKMTQK
jgi:hypothetical protein